MEQSLTNSPSLEGDFLAVMSHDLRNPLHCILLQAECLRDGCYGDLSEEQARVLDQIAAAGRQLNGLVDNVLLVARKNWQSVDLCPTEFDLIDSIDSSGRMFKDAANAGGVHLDWPQDQDELWIDGDSGKVQQMLMTVIGLAVRFCDRGSVIVTLKSINDEVIIAVAANGLYLSDEDIELFQKGWPSVAERENLPFGKYTLGHFLSKAIAEAHDGALAVSSHHVHGTRWHIALPLKQR